MSLSAVVAAPVGDALQRPAVMVREPQHAVLLAGAQAGKRIVAVGERGVIALSDDDGTTWHQAPCPVSVTLTMVRFVDNQHGVAVGHGGTVLTTSDAGRELGSAIGWAARRAYGEGCRRYTSRATRCGPLGCRWPG